MDLGSALAILPPLSDIWKLSEDKQLHKKTQVHENKVLYLKLMNSHGIQGRIHRPLRIWLAFWHLCPAADPLCGKHPRMTQPSRCVHGSHTACCAWTRHDLHSLTSGGCSAQRICLSIRVTAMDRGSNAEKRMIISPSNGVLQRTC